MRYLQNKFSLILSRRSNFDFSAGQCVRVLCCGAWDWCCARSNIEKYQSMLTAINLSPVRIPRCSVCGLSVVFVWRNNTKRHSSSQLATQEQRVILSMATILAIAALLNIKWGSTCAFCHDMSATLRCQLDQHTYSIRRNAKLKKKCTNHKM